MMKAARLHAVGDLRCDGVEIPVPHGKELLLRVGACGICGSDLPRVFEHGSSNGRYPLTIGHEFAGEVVAVGEEADASLVGARGAVFPLIPCRRCASCAVGLYAMCENYDYLGSRRDGGFAEHLEHGAVCGGDVRRGQPSARAAGGNACIRPAKGRKPRPGRRA